MSSATSLLGVAPSTLRYDFAPVAPENAEQPDVEVLDCDRRFREVHAAYVDERWGSRAVWDDYWRNASPERLRAVFSLEELVRIWYGSGISSRLTYWIEEEHFILEKLRLCHWRYGYARDYNAFVRHLAALRRLAVPGFEVRLAWTNKWNTQGWAVGGDFYLDAGLGLLVYDRGRHVMTVGFAPSRHGVLVAQAQLRERRGNRWLYRLSAHHLDAALGAISAAFEGEDVWLVDGDSAAEAVRRSYGSDGCKLSREELGRVAALYDRPLAAFRRTAETAYAEGREYVRLERLAAGAL